MHVWKWEERIVSLPLLRQDLPSNWKLHLARLASQWAPRNHISLPSKATVRAYKSVPVFFHTDAGDLNSGPHACRANGLTYWAIFLFTPHFFFECISFLTQELMCPRLPLSLLCREGWLWSFDLIAGMHPQTQFMQCWGLNKGTLCPLSVYSANCHIPSLCLTSENTVFLE